MWPNFFIVGASKSGTTSLYTYLDRVPGIFMSEVKEPHYFHRGSFKLIARSISDKFQYLKLFKLATKEQAIGEASTSYLEDPESAHLIHEEVSDAKIIIILRDPCQRAFSGYLMFKSEGREKRSFHQLITTNPEFLESGLYYAKVKRYWEIFGSKQVKVLIFEEFIKDTKDSIKEILEFLQVDSKPPENFEEIYNPYQVPRGLISKKILTNKTISRFSDQLIPKSLKWKLKDAILVKNEKKPDLEKEDRLILENYYFDDVKKLQNLLKRRLPWGWIEKNFNNMN